MIIGIDNGIDGGLCAVSKFNGDIIDKLKMPTIKFDDKREVDIKMIYAWLMDFSDNITLAIEEPLKHAKSSQAMRSMGISFGRLLGMAESHGIKVERVDVRTWQKAMLGKIPAGHTKKAALIKANQLRADEDWRANSRCKVPHDGIIDAFLIALYVRDLYEKDK